MTPSKNCYTPKDVDPMEVFYQRRCYKYIYVIPVGLRELMSDISREVLRTHPIHVYSFIADYLESLMVTRENIRVATRFVDDVSNTGQFIAELVKATATPAKVIIAKVVIIQRFFRGYLRKKYFYKEDDETASQMLLKCLAQLKVSKHRANLAAIVIQRAYRQYKEHIENLETAPTNVVNWKLASRNTFRIFSRTEGVKFWELNDAARKIQAAYRGYYTRRKILEFSEQRQEVEEEMSGMLDYIPVIEEQRKEIPTSYETKEAPISVDYARQTVDEHAGGSPGRPQIAEEPTEEMTDYIRKLFYIEGSKKDRVEITPFDESALYISNIAEDDNNQDEFDPTVIGGVDDADELHYNTRIDVQNGSIDDMGSKIVLEEPDADDMDYDQL